MVDSEKIKIINFLQDFSCATLEQLQILYNRPNDNFKDILNTNLVNKKGNIFVHKTKEIDMKMIYALNVLCKYKGRFKQFHRGFFPIYISFLTKDNILYHVIVSEKTDEKGLLKLLRVNASTIPEADKFILLFPDDSCFEEIECNIPYMYCIYPDMKIVNKKLGEESE